MQRRHFLGSLCGLAAVPGLTWASTGGSIQSTQRIREIYQNSVVVDGLAYIGSAVPWPPHGLPPDRPLSNTQLRNAAESGITAVQFRVDSNDFQGTVRNIAFWLGEIDANPNRLLLVKRIKDLERAKEEKKLCVILGFKDTECIGRDRTLFDVFHKLGVRVIQLTYNIDNLVGSGCLEPQDGGLTKLGRKALADLNDLGIAVDLSHCGPRTTADAIALSDKPIVITHTGCNSVYRNPRNKDDNVLRAMANKGGVVGIYMMPFLGRDGTRHANLSMFLDHLDRAILVCGAEHVGIGSDNSTTPVEETPEYLKMFQTAELQRAKLGIQAPDEAGRSIYVPELNTPRRIETVALAMSKRGHSDDVIEKVIGKNFQRVFGKIWKE